MSIKNMSFTSENNIETQVSVWGFKNVPKQQLKKRVIIRNSDHIYLGYNRKKKEKEI